MPYGVLALAAVFLLKLAVLLQLAKHPLLQPDAGLDTTAYFQLAQQVAGGNLALGPGVYFVSPLYIYFLALIIAIAKSTLAIRVVQIALGTLAVWLVFRTAEQWHGRRAAWIAGGLATFTGLFTFYESLILQAALDPFLTALALALLAFALGSGAASLFPGVRGFLFTGVAFGVLALNRPNVLIAIAGILVILLVRRHWRPAAFLAAGLVLALLPLTIRNAIVARDLAPVSSHGGLNFFIGNNPEADGTYHSVEGITPSIAGQQQDARRVAERAVGRPLTDSDVSAYFYTRGWQWIRGNPGAAMKLFARKIAYTLNAAHLSLNYSYPYYTRDEHTLLRYLPVGAWLLIPLGLVGLWIGAPEDPERRRAFYTWAAFIPLYILAVALFFASERYRLPLLIPFCVTGAGAIASFGQLGHPRLAGSLGVLLALFMFVNQSFGLDEGRAEEQTRMTIWLIGQERFDEASARIVRIERDHPQPGVLNFRIGRALLTKGRPDDAIRHLQRAKEKDANQAEIDFVLGQAYLEAKRPAEAIPHLRRAVEANVRADVAGYDLSRAYAATGDRAAAIRTLQNVRPARRDDAASWFALGKLALDLEAPRMAVVFLREAVTANPNVAESHEQLGLALSLSGMFDDAAREMEEAVRIDPQDATARLNLAVALAEIGKLDDARLQARSALRLDPNYEKAKEFLRVIAEK